MFEEIKKEVAFSLAGLSLFVGAVGCDSNAQTRKQNAEESRAVTTEIERSLLEATAKKVNKSSLTDLEVCVMAETALAKLEVLVTERVKIDRCNHVKLDLSEYKDSKESIINSLKEFELMKNQCTLLKEAFPPEAIYMQDLDLSILIKLIEESQLNSRYDAATSYNNAVLDSGNLDAIYRVQFHLSKIKEVLAAVEAR